MARRNRVTPLGEIIADPARGLLYGNRGCLHDAEGRIERRFAGRRWIVRRLEFRGWKRGRLQQPGRFTELFFLDEATAFASGHRPCALCRHEDYRAFVAIWHELHPRDELRGPAIDARLHAERVEPRSGAQLHHRMRYDELPDGAFVVEDEVPLLVLGGLLFRWAPGGYDLFARCPAGGSAVVLTPPSLLGVLAAGWRPDVGLVHPSAAPPFRMTG